MAPIIPGLIKDLHRKPRLARQSSRPATSDELLVYEGSKKRAQRKGISFFLTKQDFDILVTRANGCCEDTGLPFNNNHEMGQRIRPNRLSIDRLVSTGPYSLQNTRLILASVNISRNSQTLTNFHIRRLIYFARVSGNSDLIPDKLVKSRIGDIGNWIF